MAKSTSDQNSFTGSRGGVSHCYEVREDSLAYCASTPSGQAQHYAKRYEIPWQDVARLHPGHEESLYFVRSSGQKLGVWLDPATMQTFLPLAIAAWGKKSSETARSAGLDYGKAHSTVGWACLALSLALPGLTALVLRPDPSFGWALALMAAVGIGLSIARICRRHPYREVVGLAAEKIQPSK